jgi:formylglycine-generating enzyme required for sulfatase activity
VKKLETQLASATTSVTPAKRPVKVSPSIPDLPEVKPGDYKMEVADNGVTITLPGGVKLELLKIKAGDFMMGRDDEPTAKPAHHVVITKDFMLGKYEVTQAQYEAVMGRNPSRDAGPVNKLNVGPDNPVDSLTCKDADAFAARVEQGVGSAAVHFCLPTEAQWEYACRAGTTTRCFHGDKNDDSGDFGWYDTNSGGRTHPVGQKKPNPWGLYDMYGNLFEWCSDLFDHFYYNKTPPEEDTMGPLPEEVAGRDRSMRGGSWQYGVVWGNSAGRGGSFGDPGHHIGFRLAAVPR